MDKDKIRLLKIKSKTVWTYPYKNRKPEKGYIKVFKEYNKNGNCTKMIEYKPNGKIIKAFTFKYNKKGKSIEHEYTIYGKAYAKRIDRWNKNKMTTVEYNSKGNIKNKEEWVCKYDKKRNLLGRRNLLKKRHTKFDKILEVEKYIYDAKDNVIEQRIYDKPNRIKEISKNVFEYYK